MSNKAIDLIDKSLSQTMPKAPANPVPKAKKLNPEQQAILDSKYQRPIVVSASAGTGKTEVLARRIAKEILSDTERASIQEVLVLTFTKKAAINMRARIVKTLHSILEQTEDADVAAWLREQINLAPLAPITTIDAFCLHLLREYLPELLMVENLEQSSGQGDLPPLQAGFGVASKVVSLRLLREATSQVLDELDAKLFLSKENSSSSKQIVAKRATSEQALFNLDTDDVDEVTWLEQYETMCRTVAPGSSNEQLIEVLIDKINALRSMSEYRSWCQNEIQTKRQELSDFNAIASVQSYLRTLRAFWKLFGEGWHGLYHSAEMQALKDCAANSIAKEIIGFASYVDTLDSVWQTYSRSAPEEISWQQFVKISEALDNVVYLTDRSSKGLDHETKTYLRAEFGTLFVPLAQMLGIGKSYTQAKQFGIKKPLPPICSFEQVVNDLAKSVTTCSRFLEVLLMVDSEYTLAKRRHNLVDFADVEHLAQKLLSNSEVRERARAKLKCVFVDEYQDTNDLQEALLALLLPEKTFVVGDIKQSIYVFRHARPELMQNRMQKAEETQGEAMELFQLKRNYRSTAGLHAFVNVIFDRLLTKAEFGIEYDAMQWLVSPSNQTQDVALSPDVTLAVLHDAQDNESDDAPAVQASETTLALQVINELRETKIATGELGYGDIAILTRTNDQALAFQQALAEAKVPVRSAMDPLYFQTSAYYRWSSLLTVINNAYDEYALVAFLKSKFVPEPLSDAELMILFADKLRGTSPLQEIKTYLEVNSSGKIADKVSAAMALLSKWQELSKAMTVTDLLDAINVEACLSEAGNATLKEIEGFLQFREMVSNIEGEKCLSIRELLAELELLVAKPKRLQEFMDSVSAEENVVQVLTMHGSKGLEFKVVLLAGLNPKRSASDKSRILLTKHGVSAVSVDDNVMRSWQNPNHAVHKAQIAKEERAEMMRLLYVALTRAEQKMYLLCHIEGKLENTLVPRSNLEAIPSMRYLGFSDNKDEMALLEAKRNQERKTVDILVAENIGQMLEPILYAYAADLRNYLTYDKTPPFLQVKIYSVTECQESLLALQDSVKHELDRNAVTVANFGMGEKIKELATPLSQSQVNEAIEVLKELITQDTKELERRPAKISVSELKRRQQIMEAHEDNENEAVKRIAMTAKRKCLAKSTAKTSQLTGAELGTALHAVFQYFNFEQLCLSPTAEEVKRQLAKMVLRHQITKEQSQAGTDFANNLIEFAQSEIFAAMPTKLDNKRRSYREMPFAFIEPNEGEPDYAGTLIQGVIDLWFTNEDETITLVDFKSDHLEGDKEVCQTAMQKSYGTQMAYYKMALEQATGRQVKKTLIWLIRRSLCLDIDTSQNEQKVKH